MRGLFESTHPSLPGAVLLLLRWTAVGAVIHTFDDCRSTSSQEYSIWGAEVYSQFQPNYALKNNDCTLTFKAKFPNMRLLVQVVELDIRSERNEAGHCLDHLSLVENLGTNSSSVLLPMFCGKLKDLPIDRTFYTSGSHLSITWHVQGSGPGGLYKGFHIILTAVVQTSVPCEDLEFMDCGSSHCIHPQLGCDGTRHCLNGQDENHCNLGVAPIPNMQQEDGTPTPTPSPPPEMTTPLVLALDQNVYLWLPLVVVLMFTAAMVTLVLIGRRGDHPEGYQNTSEEVNLSPVQYTKSTAQPESARRTLAPSTTTTESSVDGIGDGPLEGVDTISIVLVLIVFALILIVCLVLGWREKKAREREEMQQQTRVPIEASPLTNMNESLAIDINSNPAFGMGPPSPPPRYSYLERQTSFTSYISQTSDMLSIPPGYDEAIELPGNGTNGASASSANGARNSHLSRSSTGSSRRTRRPWPFSRSASGAQDIRRNRHSTGNTPSSRQSSSTSSDNGLARMSIDSNISDVFAESPPSVISEESGEEENISPSLPPTRSHTDAMNEVLARMSGIPDSAGTEVPPSPSTQDTAAPSGSGGEADN